MANLRFETKIHTNLALIEFRNETKAIEKQWRFLCKRGNEHLLNEGIIDSMFHEIETSGMIVRNGDVRFPTEDDEENIFPGVFAPPVDTEELRFRQDRLALILGKV